MELSRIEKLLEKYFEGETTISEERELKKYFTTQIVPTHLKGYQSLFQYFSEEGNEVVSSDFTLRNFTRVSRYKWIGVAASIAFIVGVFITNYQGKKTGVDTYEDPLVALEKTKEILNMVAQHMNRGTQDLRYLQEFENTKNKLIK